MIRSAFRTIAVGAMLAGFAGTAHAADYLAQSGFGSAGADFSQCKSGSSTNAFATGTQLSASDYVGGCVGGFSVDIDTVAKTITLNNFQAGNYETGYLQITGITGTTITGLSTVNSVGLFDPAYYGNPSVYGAIPTPSLSFTSDSLRIVFSSFGGTPPQFTYGEAGQAVFSYTTAAGAVPEPATWAMMLFGFGVVGFGLRQRKKSGVRVTYA